MGVLLLVPHAVLTAQSMEKQILSTPRGKVVFLNPVAYEELVWIQEHTRPTQYFYDISFATSESFYLDLRNPTPIPFVTSEGYTTPEQVAEAVRSLKQHEVRYILVWLPDWLGIGRKDDHLDPLRDYIRSHYRAVKDFADSDEVWEKKD